MTTSAPTGPHPGVLQTWRATGTAARALIIGLFVQKFGAFLQVFLVLFLVHRGISRADAGLALGVLGGGSTVGVLAGGWLTDRIGPRRTVIGALAGAAVCTMAVLVVHPLWLVLLVVFAVGTISQAYRPAAASMLAALTPRRSHVMIFSMYRMALNLGTTAAPLVALPLVAVSYNLLFLVEGGALLCYAVITAIAIPATVSGGDEPSDDGPDTATTDPVPAAARMWTDRAFVLFLVATFVNAVVYVQYLSTLPLAVTVTGMGTGVYSVLVAVNGALVITLELVVTRWTQRWPAWVAAGIGMALGGLGLALYAAPLGVSWFVGATAVWTFGEIVAAPTMAAYPARAGRPALRGRYIAAAQAAFGLGFAVGPVLGVAVWDRFGAPMWLACGVVGVAAAGLARFAIHDDIP
jgi:MFS family permease